MFNLTVFKILLFKCRSVLSQEDDKNNGMFHILMPYSSFPRNQPTDTLTRGKQD